MAAPMPSYGIPTYSAGSMRPSMKNMLAPSDYAVWILGVTLQLIGMIVLTFHGPKDGDTRSDTTFLYAGWAIFVIGSIAVLVKIFRLRK